MDVQSYEFAQVKANRSGGDQVKKMDTGARDGDLTERISRLRSVLRLRCWVLRGIIKHTWLKLKENIDFSCSQFAILAAVEIN